MAQINMHEAKTTLSRLVERAEAGEEIVIARNGAPAVTLVPVAASARFADSLGCLEGQVWMAEDFDDPAILPPDFRDAFDR